MTVKQLIEKLNHYAQTAEVIICTADNDEEEVCDVSGNDSIVVIDTRIAGALNVSD